MRFNQNVVQGKKNGKIVAEKMNITWMGLEAKIRTSG